MQYNFGKRYQNQSRDHQRDRKNKFEATLQSHIRRVNELNSKLITSFESNKEQTFPEPVQNYLDKLPTLKEGVIAGVFKTEGATSWAPTRAEKLQVSMFLPDYQSMDEWLATVHAWLTYCVARYVYDWLRQHEEGDWLWPSGHSDQVSGVQHVGYHIPQLGIVAAKS